MGHDKTVIISTTDNLEGYEIDKYVSILNERIVVGAGLFSEFLAGFTDVFGGRSNVLEQRLRELYTEVEKRIIETATKKKCDAVIGYKVDVDEISGKGFQMFMVTAVGTGVKLKSINTANAPLHSYQNGILFTDDEIRTKILEREFFDAIRSTIQPEAIDLEFKNIINQGIELPLDKLLLSLNDTSNLPTYDFESCKIDWSTSNYAKKSQHLHSYLGIYPKDLLQEEIYKIIATESSFSSFFMYIAHTHLIPNYEKIEALLKVNKTNPFFWCPVLKKYKFEYFHEDLEHMKHVIHYLEEQRTKVRITKSTSISKKQFSEEAFNELLATIEHLKNVLSLVREKVYM